MGYLTKQTDSRIHVCREYVLTMESGFVRSFAITASFLLLFFIILNFFFLVAYAATYIVPPQTVTIVAEQIDQNTIAITLTNSQTLLNTAEVEFFFDPTHILVTDVLISDSLCMDSFVITKEIDNIQGRVFYQCGTYIPFAGADTVLATLKVIPLKIGTSPLSFGNNTNVLAHDGYGSNVTKDRLASIFQFSG